MFDRIVIALVAFIYGAIWFSNAVHNEAKNGMITFGGVAYKTQKIEP